MLKKTWIYAKVKKMLSKHCEKYMREYIELIIYIGDKMKVVLCRQQYY